LNDIDDRVRAEVALANSEREFRHIVNMVPGMIILSQPDGTLDASNQQLLDYFGITLDEVQDWSTNGITHPDDVQVNIDTFIGSLRSGEPYDYESRYRRHDGVFRWFQVRGQPLRDAEGNIVRWYGLLTDIDDRKHVEDELRTSQAFLAAGQRISSTGTFSWDIDTDELTLSDEFLRIFDFEEGTVVTFDRIRERIHPDDLALLAEKMAAVREGHGNAEYEIRLVDPNGDIKFVRVIGKVIRHQDGRRESLGAIQDVTRSRLTEEARDQLRAELGRVTGFLSLSQMSAAVAHEVNQPLAGIVMNANTCLRMLSAEPPDIDTALETARRTIRDARRAEEVIAKLRALFSKRGIAFQDLDLNDAVHEVVALTAGDQRRNGIAVRTSFDSSLPSVNGDRVQLQQVISNLLRNAVDSVSGVKDRLRFIDVRTELDEEGRIRLAVTDNGVGFGSDGPSRIFEAFYTTKNDGMGIGLAVCRSIIESHGGRLWALPNDGPGVTMYFAVPRNSAEEIDTIPISGTVSQ
jgi:PAS domain S-box-containing protein